MTRVLDTIILAVAVSTAGVAMSATLSTARPISARQQLNACMTKAMVASRTLSYNDASKMCKAQLRQDAPTLASNAIAPKH
jgi:hypothetical protein